MQAIILAAGMGKRLKELTADNTKCMVKVNGVSLIERALLILDKKGLSKIIIVVGYMGDKLINYVNGLNINTQLIFIDNPLYDKTNNIYSLSLAENYLLEEDTLLLESDLIFEEAIIDILLNDARKNLVLVDKYESWMDGTSMILNDEDQIQEFVLGKQFDYSKKDMYYKTVNIYKFSRSFLTDVYVPFLKAYVKAMGTNEYYESVIKVISILESNELYAKRLDGQIWYEIDDIHDLDVAQSLFANSDEERYRAFAGRYGGYWRYPGLKDYCYLVNPYYPPRKLLDELKSNFEELIIQYPSGMRVNSLLASKCLGIRKEYTVVGNGAAELIKALMEKVVTGRVGCIRPTFEEYPNRHIDNIIEMTPLKDDFSYDVQDIISFFKNQKIDFLVLINPDNPSGNYISYTDTKKLLDWCRQNGIVLILDESFVDFATCSFCDGEKFSFLDNEVLQEYKENLIVVKSISKSYGVPGIRLGVVASANEDLISFLKRNVAIWNINSFGEYYMQIAEKYKQDYVNSIKKIKDSRKSFFNELSKIDYLIPIPSEANYIMCRVTNGVTSKYLAERLLRDGYLIKDLTNKINNGQQYIRLAVKKYEENEQILTKLRGITIPSHR